MFGYIQIHKPELKFREFDQYQGCYCGLCQSLKERYSNPARLTLSFDMTFLAMLLTGLYEPEEICAKCRCCTHPFRKRLHVTSAASDYAADMSVLLYRDKFMDDWLDERKFTRRFGAAWLHRSYRKAQKRYPEKAVYLVKSLDSLHMVEKNGETNIDQPANCFGDLLAEIFVWREDEWAPTLRQIGFYLGKFIYLLDAYADLDHDISRGCYNPLVELAKTSDDFDNDCQQMLEMMIATCTEQFERLPILRYVEILRNILYAGVWTQFYEIRERRSQKEAKNGSV